MRSTSAGRWSGAPRSLLPGPVDKKNPRPDASAGPSAAPSSTLTRPTSAQKMRPGSRLNVMESNNGRPTTPTNIGRPTTPTNIGRPTTPTNIRPTTPTAVRATTPTSTSRSLSATRTRPAVHQLFKAEPTPLQGPIPIDQRSKFSVSRSVSTPSKDIMSPGGAGTPSKPKTPNAAAREVKVGPYGHMLRELKREKNMFVKDDTKERDLKTLANQLQLFKLQLKKKFETDRVQEERLLLQAWQMVYDAEEEAFGLRSKERIALEINKIHAQLVDMDNRVDQVNNFIAPVFEKLNAYVNLRMHQTEEEKNATQVRSMTAKASINREYSAAFLKLDKSIRVLERMMEKRDRLTGPVKTPEPKRTTSFTFEMPVLTPVTEDKKIKKTISSNTFEVPALVHVENFVDDSVAMPGTIKESSKPTRRPSRENMGGGLTASTKLGLKTGSGSSTGSPIASAAPAPTTATTTTTAAAAPATPAAPAAAAAPVLSTPVRASNNNSNATTSAEDSSPGHTLLTPKSSSENLKKGFMRPTQSTTHHVEETREAHHHHTLTPKSSMENVKKDISPKTSNEHRVLSSTKSSENLKKDLSPKHSSGDLKKELTPKMSMDNVKKGLTPKPSMENLTVKSTGLSPKGAAAGIDNNKSFRRINSNGSLTGIQRPSSANSLRKNNSNPTLTGSKKSSGSATPTTPTANSKVHLDLGDIQTVDDDVNVDDEDAEITTIPAAVSVPTHKEAAAAASATKERPRSANSISYAARATPDPAPNDGRHSINLAELSNLKGLSSGGGFDDFASKLASLESGFYQIPEFKPKTKRSKSIDRSQTPTDGSSTPSILKNNETNKTSLSNGAAIADLTTGGTSEEASAATAVPAVHSPVKSAVAASLTIDSSADLIPLNNSSGNNSPTRSTPGEGVPSLPSPKKTEAVTTTGETVPTEKLDLAAKIAALESKSSTAAVKPAEETQPAPAQSNVQKSYADFLAKNKNNSSFSVEKTSATTAPVAAAVTVEAEKPVVPAADAPAVASGDVAANSDVTTGTAKKSYADFLAKNKSTSSSSSTTTLTIETSPSPVLGVEEKPAVVAAEPVPAVAATDAAASTTTTASAAAAVPSGSAYSNFLNKFKSQKASPVTVVETKTTPAASTAPEEPVSIVTASAVAPAAASVITPEPSPNANLGTFSVDSSAPTPPRNSYSSFLSKTKPQSSLSVNANASFTSGSQINSANNAINAMSTESMGVSSVESSVYSTSVTSITPTSAASEIPTPSRNAYAEFMAKKNSTQSVLSASTADLFDSLPSPAARPPVPPGSGATTSGAATGGASTPPTPPAPAAAAAPAPAAKSAYGAFLSKNKANSTSFYSKSDVPAVASSSAYIDVPATNIATSVVVDDEPPPSVYTAHRMSLKRQEQVPSVVREEIVQSNSSDKLAAMGSSSTSTSENQPVAPPAAPSKNAYADFLKKRPSITAPSNTSTSHLDENSTEATGSAGTSPKPAESTSVKVPSSSSPAAAPPVAPVPAAAAPAAAPAASGNAYAAFLRKNSSGYNPSAQVSYTAVAATEEPVVDIATLRASAEASTVTAPTTVVNEAPSRTSSSLTIETSEKPPRPVSTRSAYADFLSKKKSSLPSDGSNLDDEAASGGVSASASPASVSSTASASAGTTTEGNAAAATMTTSGKLSYQDFIKKKADPTTPKKGPSVDYGATAATWEETTPAATSEGVAVLKPGEFTAYGEILAKFKKVESEEVMKPNSPSSKNNKTPSPKATPVAAGVALEPAVGVALPAPTVTTNAAAATVQEQPVQQQQQTPVPQRSLVKEDSTDEPLPPIEQTVSQDYYGSKNNTPDKSIPVTPAAADDFEPREGIENYDSFDEHDQQFNKPIDWESGKVGSGSTPASSREKSNSVDGTSSGRVQGLPPLQPSGSKPKGLSRFMSFTMSSPSPKKPPSESGSVDGQLMSPSQGSSQGSVDENGEPKKKKRNPIHFLQKNMFGRQSSSKI